MVDNSNGHTENTQSMDKLLPYVLSGEFKPVMRKRVPPAWERKTIIGTDRDLKFHTEIKCYVHRPTLQYPTASLILQLNNAKSSTFVRLNGTHELEAIIQFLNECITEASEVITNLRPAVEEASKMVEEYESLQKQIDMMSRMEVTD